MKQFFLGYLLSALLTPTLSMAQTAQLTEQLGKTVLYGDLALSPDVLVSSRLTPRGSTR